MNLFLKKLHWRALLLERTRFSRVSKWKPSLTLMRIQVYCITLMQGCAASSDKWVSELRTSENGIWHCYKYSYVWYIFSSSVDVEGEWDENCRCESRGLWFLAKEFPLEDFFYSIFCSNFCKYTSQILFLYKYSIRLVLMRQNFMCILHFLFFLELNKLSENIWEVRYM